MLTGSPSAFGGTSKRRRCAGRSAARLRTRRRGGAVTKHESGVLRLEAHGDERHNKRKSGPKGPPIVSRSACAAWVRERGRGGELGEAESLENGSAVRGGVDV